MKYTPLDGVLKQRWLIHTVFWVVILTVQSQVFLYHDRTFYLVLFNTLALVPSNLLAGYFLIYYQIPKLIYRKQYFLFILSLILSVYFSTVLARCLTVFVAEPILGIEENTEFWPMLGRILISIDRLGRNYLLSVYLAPLIMASISLVIQRGKEKARFEVLEGEKRATELNFLKTQIHPHFLLNTLNNIYALTLKKSDQAPESVLRLSEMLTYVLYRCYEKYVLLKNEIELLDNYISLELLRYGDDLKFNFDKQVSGKDVEIAPLILLSIVENAFKHGASGAIDTAEIDIMLKSTNEEVFFKVFNTKNVTGNTDKKNKGIGSFNIKKQLDLLYPKNHKLTLKEDNSTYEITVIIYLN